MLAPCWLAALVGVPLAAAQAGEGFEPEKPFDGSELDSTPGWSTPEVYATNVRAARSMDFLVGDDAWYIFVGTFASFTNRVSKDVSMLVDQGKDGSVDSQRA